VLRERERVSADEVLAELGCGADSRLTVMRSMKLLIDSDYLVGKVLTGDATLQDVTANNVTEKGLQRLGQWRDANQELVMALIAALNAAAEKAEPKEATELGKAADQLGRISRDVLVGVLVGGYPGLQSSARAPVEATRITDK
jgi:hypothetical protein